MLDALIVVLLSLSVISAVLSLLGQLVSLLQKCWRRLFGRRDSAQVSHRQRPSNKRELRQQLTRLSGSERTAQRLFTATRRRYPKQSEQWCWEKALSDLERDRR